MPAKPTLGQRLKGLLRRFTSPLRVRRLRRRGVQVRDGVTLLGSPIITMTSRSTIALGNGVSLISRPEDTALGVGHPVILRTLREGAAIEIGDHSGLSGVTVCAARRVTVGKRVLIGADVLISDTDFHPIDTVPRRYEGLPAGAEDDAVTIEDDVFIGARSVVLAGSRIGAGSVIGAGSIVSGEIPPRVVAVGNPCRAIRGLSGDIPPAPEGPQQAGS